MPTEVPFFISHYGRSGSTFLASLLDGHPDISCKGEVFSLVNTADGPSRRPWFPDRETVRARLDLIYNGSHKASGFKFHYPGQYELYPDVYEYLLEESDRIRVIYVYRLNLLKAAISGQNARRLREMGLPVILRARNYVDTGKIHLNIVNTLKSMEKRRTSDLRYFHELNRFQYSFVVTYEDLLENQASTMRHVYSFLGVNDQHVPSAKTVKITKDDLREAVANYDDLVAALAGTKYEKYLTAKSQELPRITEWT